MEEIKMLELFGGIGAIRKAFDRQKIPYKVVDYVEIDKYAVASYNAMFGEKFEVQDVTTWNKNIKCDFIMHGSPCQDFSLAGKQAGGDIGSGTRSSLMYETIRIVGQVRPKYVMWENVKNLLSKKHKHNFDAYIETMNILGYNSYYQVLNAKDYGIPQNRERVYTISIRKDIDKGTFKFPRKEELRLRLKDMLEDEVEEKYYLKDYQIENIKKSNFHQNQRRIQEKDWCDTLCSRDWKDPKCVRVGGMYGQTTRWGLYDDKGLSPTLVAAMGEGGGYIPMVERIGGIFDTEKSKHQAGSIYNKEGLAPTLDAMQGGWRQPSIIEDRIVAGQFQPKDRDYNKKGLKREEQFECRKDCLSNAILTNEKKNCILEINNVEEPKIEVVGNYSPSNHDASRIVDGAGIAPTVKENHGTVTAIIEPQIITHNINQKVYVRKYPVDKEKLKQVLREAKVDSDMNNEWLEMCLDVPITTVEHWFRKDNSFSIPTPDIWFKLKELLKIQTDEFDKSIMTFEEKDGTYDKANRVYDEEGLAPTLTQQEEKILIKNATKQGYLEGHPGDGVYINPSVKRGTVQKGMIQTLTSFQDKGVILEDLKIRKLTPKECWRLMGFDDEDFEKAEKVNSNTQLYKQAGNSIVVNVLEKILINLFEE